MLSITCPFLIQIPVGVPHGPTVLIHNDGDVQWAASTNQFLTTLRGGQPGTDGEVERYRMTSFTLFKKRHSRV